MGQVLRARDLKLNRTVALKVLRADQRADDERRRRFFNEAQAASALNHPNIITIYDIVNEGEHDYLVMEYVQGKTLGDMLAETALTYKDVINYGAQMADALTAAHGAGIVHRDLKPGNVMVTERGLVKILDFGLAKLEAPLEDSSDPEATQLAPLTREGFIIGTCAYMSPEQAQGKPVDARSDIFSFGAVLYEMATRQRAFSGDNNITTLSAVLRDEPRSLLELSPSIPTPLERLIHRCLRKDPAERWQNMEEVRGALAALKQSADSGILGQKAPGFAPVTETLAMPAPSSAQQNPFAAAPQVESSAPGGVGKWLSDKRVLIGLAIAAVIIFAPFRENKEKPRKQMVSKTAEEIRAEVKQRLETAAQELEKAGVTGAKRETLDNDDILELVKEKVPDSVILGQIRDARTDFDLSSEEVIRLVKGGVSEKVIEGMRNPKAIASATGIPAPPVPPAAPKAGMSLVTVPDQTPVALLLSADVPSDAAAGTPIAFTAAENVRVGEEVVIPKGAPARGTLLGKTKKRLMRGSKVMFQLTDVDAMGGTSVRLRVTPQPGGERVLDFGESKSKELLARQGALFVAYVDGEQQVMTPRAKK
jgi:serine/threonine-protein kinase